ncbi:MAG TPA: hypothetical protein VM260_02335 [Pirellula sp.]|nr:hypothetical protein [Pirellula sp.]
MEDLDASCLLLAMPILQEYDASTGDGPAADDAVAPNKPWIQNPLDPPLGLTTLLGESPAPATVSVYYQG